MILVISCSKAQSVKSAATISTMVLFLNTVKSVTTIKSYTLPSFDRGDAARGISSAALTPDICTRGHHNEWFLSTVTVPKGLAIVPAGADAFPDRGFLHVGFALVRRYATT